MNECALCLTAEESIITGKLFNDGDLAVHQNCLLFSSNLVNQNSQDIDDFGGFHRNDIKKEIKRGSKLRCCFCRKKGATVGCEVKTCQKSYHYPCATEHEARIVENEALGIYRIYCKIHKNGENPESSGTSSKGINAGSRTNNGNAKTIWDNYHHEVTQLETFQTMTSENVTKKRAAIRRINSSDTDECDDPPTVIHIQPIVKSKNGSKQMRLENDDAKQNVIFSNSNSSHEEKMDMSSDEWSLSPGRPGVSQEAQSNEVRQSNAEEAVACTRNPLSLHHISEESGPNGGKCSDTSTNIDQQEIQQEIDDAQQGIPEKTTEGISTPDKKTSPGQAENFWKICKRAQCLEKIFMAIQKDLNSLQQNIANENATSKDYEIAMEILLTMNSFQEIMSEFQSEMQQNLQHLEEEKLSLQRRANLVEELAMLVHSLTGKAKR